MSDDITITDGVITYDVAQAKSAVDALITARFAESADVIVAAVQTLAVMKNINPTIKIEAVALAAQNVQAILDAVYAGHALPVPGAAHKAKPRVMHETTDTEPQEAPVNPALQALADLLTDGNVDQVLDELTDAFAAFAELSPEQQQARYDVARQVLEGKLPVDDRGVLKLASDLAAAVRDKRAADGRVTTAVEQAKREAAEELRRVKREAAEAQRQATAAAKAEAGRDVDAQVAAAKAQATADAERDIAARLAAAKAEGQREAGRSTDAQLAAARTAAVSEYRRVHGLSDELLAAIDQIMALDDENVRNARLEGIQAVADGRVDVQFVINRMVPAINDIAQVLKYGDGGVTNMGTNRVFSALDASTQNLLRARRRS